MTESCDRCGAALDSFAVCPACGLHARVSATERVRMLAGSFDERDARLAGGDPLSFHSYPEGIETARRASGLREACVWGWAEIEETPCALVVLDFAFLGGSMGLAVGEKVARAFDAARRKRLPVVTVTASGGARMQEGMVALVQMAKTVEARDRHARTGGAQVTLLTSPTTGGVYASFASLADVVFAEPGATVGFAGPRVVEELTGSLPPPEVHRAEFALEHGLVDAIIPRPEQARAIAAALRSLSGVRSGSEGLDEDAPGAPAAQTSAWERLRIARAPDRPKAPEILDALLEDATELHGDRRGSDDPAVVVRLGLLGAAGLRVVAIGQDATGDGRITPGGYGKAVRALDLAGRLGLPVVTIIDTRGADPLPASEGAGVAAAIARTFQAMLVCPSPTVALVTGEGGSGGALAMAVADRLLIWENAVFSVIAPEGAASILYRDASRAPELAERLKITASDLFDLGIADAVVPEPPAGAQADRALALAVLSARAAAAVTELENEPARQRMVSRRRRWRHAGRRSR